MRHYQGITNSEFQNSSNNAIKDGTSVMILQETTFKKIKGFLYNNTYNVNLLFVYCQFKVKEMDHLYYLVTVIYDVPLFNFFW